MEKLSDTGMLDIWRCPTCELRYIAKNYRKLDLEDQGLLIEGRSFTNVDGLPAHEERTAVTPNGDVFEQSVSHRNGEFMVERTFDLAVPYHRKAGKTDKQQDECRAVTQLLPEFNRAHKSELAKVIPDVDDREADVIATDLAGDQRVRFQVTVGDHTIWNALASSGGLVERIGERGLFERIKHVLLMKKSRAASDVVLVLDGPWVTSDGTIERFRRENVELLAGIGFLEIWYTERWPAKLAVRLTS